MSNWPTASMLTKLIKYPKYLSFITLNLLGHTRISRPYKRHEDSKIGQERSSMQQVYYQFHRFTPWMQESVSMHKTTTHLRHSRMNQARSEEEEKKRDS